MTDTLSIARDLLRCPSVTPPDAGALGVLEKLLGDAGFEVHRVTFSEPGAADIDNLYARIGTGSPHITFAGHTDVVPAGDEAAWTHGAFEGDVKDGMLYGRGAVDMKGGIACSVAATLEYLAANGGQPKGSISFLITGDEEDIAVNGTVKLLKWAAERGEKFDHCVLGEPSNVSEMGDTIKTGRRGSQSAPLISRNRNLTETPFWWATPVRTRSRSASSAPCPTSPTSFSRSVTRSGFPTLFRRIPRAVSNRSRN